MKKLALTLAVVTLATLTTSTPTLGAETPTKQSIFLTLKACEVARTSGDFAIYVPVDVSRRNIDPIDNVNIFGVKLEADQCRLQVTMHGERWVVQKEGTLMRARRDESGELRIFARDDCGNADKTPAPAPAPTPVTAATPPPPVVTEPAKKLELPPSVFAPTIHVEQNVEVKVQQLQPLLTKDQDRYHGWCGIWTDLGCTALAVGAGGVIYLATRDKGEDGVSPDADTGGQFIRAGLTARANLIPPRDGHGGGAFVGARIGW